MMNMDFLISAFQSYFNAKPAFIVRAPGRVNLIGEHTDYNDGFVLPAAIDRAVWMAVAPRTDWQTRVYSLEYQSDSVFWLHSLTRETGWGEYIKGVAAQLQAGGYSLRGFDAVMSGDIPRGAGLSSSAAVELAAARAFCAVSNIEWDAARMAALAQKAENEWVGVKCGIMDQMASAAGKEGCALFLDCRTLAFEYAPLPADVSIVIMDTTTRRGLVESAYNQRRNQCEEAAKWFGVKALRDANMEMIRAAKGLDETTLKRARHVVSENARALQSVQAMRAGNMTLLGELLNASHASLRDDFEVTNDALNQIVQSAQSHSACYGARMTGAGFGGCAVALTKKESAQSFVSFVAEDFYKRSGLRAAIYICQPSGGASVLNI